MDLTTIPDTVVNVLDPYLLQGVETLSSDASQRDYADLEISLHRRTGNEYSLETRFTPPGSSSEIRLGANTPVVVDIDIEELNEYSLEYDWMDYSQSLTKMFFDNEKVKMGFGQALARAGTHGLRLRLLFGPTAQELHSLHWETLRNPFDGSLLTTNQNILFSRYLAGDGSREVHPRTKSAVRALVVVSNPSNLGDYGLAPVDVDSEMGRARQSLNGIHSTILPSETEGCTLEALVRHLQDGYDILYLVAHGSLANDQAWLWLEDERHQVHRVPAADLVEQIRSLDIPPLLVVLASCESAGNSEGGALQALGPQICEAGAPAVIAMQGKISMNSVARSMPVFFEKLQQDGIVDRAMAAARTTLAVNGATDLWMPALFMRLKDGAIWKRSTESAPPQIKKLWKMILNNFQGRLAAEGAVQELSEDASDPDNRQAFIIQLKKSLRDDPLFAEELDKTIQSIQNNNGNSKGGGVEIKVGGDVGGNIVLGNYNTIG